jgi:tRNA pseudouridine32 synthase/23S rRNA pseudouridine746 synthase
MEFLYLDAALLVVNKPAGLLAVPGRTEPDCLAARISQMVPDALIVHRLDQPTSGLIVLARGKVHERHLSKQFQARTVQKAYEALVAGRMPADSGSIDLPLGADWPHRPRQQVDVLHGKPSLTYWQVLGYDEPSGITRLALVPLTGRTHQLRVHLQAIGHAIAGDTLYGGAQAPRLMLHACELGLLHPATGQPLHWRCPAPF